MLGRQKNAPLQFRMCLVGLTKNCRISFVRNLFGNGQEKCLFKLILLVSSMNLCHVHLLSLSLFGFRQSVKNDETSISEIEFSLCTHGKETNLALNPMRRRIGTYKISP